MNCIILWNFYKQFAARNEQLENFNESGYMNIILKNTRNANMDIY